MKSRIFAFAVIASALSVLGQDADADGILKRHPGHHSAPPTCEPGFKIVEEIVMQDVVRQVCKTVPEFKKKWVYSFIDDPFCIQDSHHGHHGKCQQCDGPFCRKQLVKREVLEPCPTMKCVIETIVERVPVKVYRKVPCDAPGGKVEVLPTLPKVLKK
jgi:hypothetical protein